MNDGYKMLIVFVKPFSKDLYLKYWLSFISLYSIFGHNIYHMSKISYHALICEILEKIIFLEFSHINLVYNIYIPAISDFGIKIDIFNISGIRIYQN